MKILVMSLICISTAFAQAKQINLDLTSSQIKWKGEKKLPGAGDHNGTVKVKKGTVSLNEKNELQGGDIVIDMTSIDDADLSGKYKTKLESHLNSEDFFHTKKHPEANFKITKVEKSRSDLYSVTGNLTLRGETHPETFDVQISPKTEKGAKYLLASGDILIDRTKYGVTYNSEAKGLDKAIKLAKDKIIKDKIQLTLELKTEKI